MEVIILKLFVMETLINRYTETIIKMKFHESDPEYKGEVEDKASLTAYLKDAVETNLDASLYRLFQFDETLDLRVFFHVAGGYLTVNQIGETPDLVSLDMYLDNAAIDFNERTTCQKRDIEGDDFPQALDQIADRIYEIMQKLENKEYTIVFGRDETREEPHVKSAVIGDIELKLPEKNIPLTFVTKV